MASIIDLTQVGTASTVRPASTSLLTVSSIDRYRTYAESRGTLDASGEVAVKYPSSPYDFLIRKNQSILNGFFSRIAVTQIRMPWIVPNINFSTQKILFITPDGPQVISLNYGFYTPALLAATLQAKIQDISGYETFTVTYGDYTSQPRFRFEPNASGQYNFAPMPPNFNSGDAGYYPYNISRRQLYDLLGLNYLITNNETNPLPYIGGGFNGGDTLCQYTNFVDIVCSNITLNQSLKDDSTSSYAFDSLCRLYITSPDQNVLPGDATFAPPGTTPQVLYYDYNSPKQIQWNSVQPIGQLQFTVVDDQGYNLDSAIFYQAPITGIDLGYIGRTGGEWNMTLQVTEN